MPRVARPSEPSKRKLPPAKTQEARENQLTSLAFDLVEKRMIEGTATSQETTHFLKLGSTREKLERRKLEAEIKLQDARVDAIASQKRTEELFSEAIKAMRSYQGIEMPDANV